MAKLIETTPYPGIGGVKENIDFYKQMFIDNSIIAFRGADISFDEQDELIEVLGESFGWTMSGIYDEDHSRTRDKQENNEYMLTWHVEHAYWERPVLGAAWYMHTFTEDPKNGRTTFYPMHKLFKELKPEWQDLALSAYIEAENYPELGQPVAEFFDSSKSWAEGETYIASRAIAVPHFITGEPTYRIANLGNKPEKYDHIHRLNNVNGSEPTEEQNQMYYEMNKYVVDKINTPIDNTDDGHMVHEWRQGDILIPDLFTMAHSVLGGFDSRKRKFRGLWTGFPEYKNK
jgi:hypothetical protein